MRLVRLAAIVVGLSAGIACASAQTAPVFGKLPGNDDRNCQTVRTCNFTRGAEVRGCLSSYTCRTCRFVQTKSAVCAASGPCQRLQCTWGG